MKPQAIVVGAGGHARVVGSSLRCLGIDICGFLDLDFVGGHEEIFGAPVIGNLDELRRFAPDHFDAHVAIGDNAKRKSIVEQLHAMGYQLPPVIHPGARLNYGVRVGSGSCVCMGTSIAAAARIGEGVIVNTGATIDHEATIGDFSHIAPGSVVAGRVSVGEGVFIGMGVRVADKVSIGNEAVIGAGSLVLKDVSSGAKVIGVHH